MLELGVNVVVFGKDRVLILKVSEEFVGKVKVYGLEVFVFDMFMFILGGGGVYCMC